MNSNSIIEKSSSSKKVKINHEISKTDSNPKTLEIPSKIKVKFTSILATNSNSDIDPNATADNALPDESDASYFIPLNSSTKDMSMIINATASKSHDHDAEDSNLEFNFYVNDTLLTKSLSEILSIPSLSPTTLSEQTITISYIPKSVFKVRSVSRCSATMSGHTQPILTASYSPDGRHLASGSGDCTVRVWDVCTQTPRFTLAGHKGWVQHVLFSPDNTLLVSAGMDGMICVYDHRKGTLMGTMKGHAMPITGLAFEPLCCGTKMRLASASKDGTVKVWDVVRRVLVGTLGGHVGPVMCVKWAGNGRIYSGGRDKMVKVWDGNTFPKLIGNMNGHGHWVNSLAMMSDFICRSGPYDHTDPKFTSIEEAHQAALKRYNTFISTLPQKTDILASCSDDFTVILWDGLKVKHRMTGHQQAVNHLTFSPNGHILATASFDKSVKLWNAITGTFITTLRGHVGAVYRVCFSSDSRKLVTASRDSTCKVWDVEGMGGKLVGDLVGHEDEVWVVDWACDGSGCVSGGKDKTLKIWKH